MSRRTWIPIAVLVGLAFLVAAAGLARALSAGGAERDAAIERVREQPMAADAEVDVLRVDGGGFSLRGRSADVRVVWRVGDGLPVVQCVRVRRSGDLASGFDVEAGPVSRPIFSERSCPKS